MNGLAKLNSLTTEEAASEFYKCCSSKTWAAEMASFKPFATEEALFSAAELIWSKVSLSDKMEAFSHHPKIGGNLQALRDKYQSTKAWASEEQKGVNQASEATLEALSQGNETYEKKFGFVFLICATGKSADEMNAALQARLQNSQAQEIENATHEQGKITRIRLKKLLEQN